MKIKGPQSWSMGIQLALGFSLITVLTLGIVGTVLVNNITRRALAERTSMVLTQARVAADLASEVQFSQNPAGLPLALFNFHLQTGVRPVVVRADGLVVADSWIPSPLEKRKLTQPELLQALQGEEAYGYRQVGAREWALYAAVPLPPDQQVGRAVLVSADLTELELGLRETRLQLIWGLTGGGLTAVLAGFLVAHHLSRPLGRLDSTVTALTQGKLEARVQPDGSREIRDLGRRFNLMADELARVDAQRRDFVAAASHEMRTPMATIRVLAEALLNDRKGDMTLYKEYLGDIVSEADRAGHVMERLLELARLEGQSTLRPASLVDVASICSDIVDTLLPVAEKRGIELTIQAGTTPVWTKGEPFLVDTVVSNLAENALKYTPAGGRVNVNVVSGPDEVWVEVRDTGPGIAPEHLPHLFERFYRVDPSRARPTGGVGLGLAIAAEAARLMHGRLEVESAPGQGSCFSLIVQTAAAE